jgi:metal-dependent amidase/aminoacylase/carboxypeptidase family protein
MAVRIDREESGIARWVEGQCSSIDPDFIRHLKRRAMQNRLSLPTLIIATLILGTGTASAQQPAPEIDRQIPTLLERYKALHQHPELSHHETWTAAYVADALLRLGFTVTEHVGRYQSGAPAEGLIAVLQNGSGPRLLLHTELDALPLEEKTGLAYASHLTSKDDAGQSVGVMHACGHDIHMTTIIGTASSWSRKRTNGTARS